jgi:hypothetical protein
LPHVVVAQLSNIHSTLDAALFEVRSDGSVMNAELVAELRKRAASLIAGDEFVYVGIGQPALDREAARV